MQQWTRIKEAEAESDLGLALVVDAELFRLDAVIRWLDAADGRLKRACRRPAPARVRGPAQAAAAGGDPVMRQRMLDLRTGDGAMTVLELRDVSKFYGQGAARVEALRTALT